VKGSVLSKELKPVTPFYENGVAVDFVSEYRGINKPLRRAAVEDLRVHRILLFITSEEMNKQSKYTIVYASLWLNNRSSCADAHVRFIICRFP
jgi:hypothetical protein